MSNELANIADGNLLSPETARRVNIQAKNYSEIQNIEKVGVIKNEYHYHASDNIIDESSDDIDLGFQYDKYHLFVIGSEPEAFSYNNFIIPIEKVLSVEDTSEVVRNKYLPMTEEVISELKGYVAIIARENAEYGEFADSDQEVKIAKIEEITIQNNGIRIKYKGLGKKKKSELYRFSEELGMGSGRRIPEFKYNHWAIKEVNLRDVFRKAKIQLFDFI